MHADDLGNFRDGPLDQFSERLPPGIGRAAWAGRCEDSRRFVMLVNKRLKRSVHCTPVFRPSVKTAKYVSPIAGELKPFVARL